MINYWMVSISQSKYEIFIKNKDKQIEFTKKYQKRVKRIEVDDRIIIYIKDIKEDGCEFLAPDNAVVVGVKTARAAIEDELAEAEAEAEEERRAAMTQEERDTEDAEKAEEETEDISTEDGEESKEETSDEGGETPDAE